VNARSSYTDRVVIYTRDELMQCPHSRHASATGRKDRRYYELIEDAIQADFNYGYFAIENNSANVSAIQPFFVLDQGLLVGIGSKFKFLIRHLRRLFPPCECARLNINYSSFEEYMKRALNGAGRSDLRRKFQAARQASPIEMGVVGDIIPMIDDIFSLYMNVYNRSKLHFEKLTREYFCGLNQLMLGKVQFFVWRQNGRVVALAVCMVQEETFIECPLSAWFVKVCDGIARARQVDAMELFSGY
jgi:hypothetical protein